MKSLANLITCIAVIAILNSCASTPKKSPGYTREGRSTIDDSVELSMEPSYVFRRAGGLSGSDLMLALFWRSSMPPSMTFVTAYVDGTHKIPRNKSLHFKVDGEIVSYSSFDTETDIKTEYDSSRVFPRYKVSSMRYVVSLFLIEKIIAAKNVKIRLDLDNSYVEGVFSDNTPTAAKPAFTRFYERLRELQ
jgi:hypothetical protein